MNLIFTNDDGIEAAGLKALIDPVLKGGEFKAAVVAPANERSASSHSISLGQKLRIEETLREGIPYYAVHGTPADCVKFAVSELRDFKPDLIISGVNQGANTGVSVYYSGTISAAREGLINRIPAMALSLCSKTSPDFRASVQIAYRLVRGYQSGAFPNDLLLNINVPALAPEKIRGLKITKQAASRFVEEFAAEKTADGKKVYSLVGEIMLYDKDGTSDEEAVSDGYISLTPLRLDMTDYDAIRVFEDWLKKQ